MLILTLMEHGYGLREAVSVAATTSHWAVLYALLTSPTCDSCGDIRADSQLHHGAWICRQCYDEGMEG